MNKRWVIKDNNRIKAERLVEELKLPPIIAQLLVNRNVTHPKEVTSFLNNNLSDLHSPLLLKGMKTAVARVQTALSKGEKILIYGDYDVDGITSVALLSRVLRKLGGNVIEYIPNRLEEGYGLNLTACQLAYRKKVNLVITVDCGISASKEIDYLNGLGIDTVVTDHHQPDNDNLPMACAVVDPFQKGCSYPFKHLAGVGLVFKLVQALLDKEAKALQNHLDLVALGTVADVVPQLGENRILTKYGLSTLAASEKCGIKELIRVAGLKGKELNSMHIGYILGPRINAAGRIGSPKLPLKLLTTEKPEEAKELARVLNEENKSRQKIQSNVYEEALEKVNREVNFKEHKVIVLAKEGWHPGVIGVVASRLADKFYRPTVMISVKGNTGRGSARSIKGLHLFNIMSKCRNYLDAFGGHAGACGLTIRTKSIDSFRDSINEAASEVLTPEDLQPFLKADMRIPLNKLSAGLITELDRLAPFGPGNPEPLFISENLTIKHGPKRVGKKGFKLWVTDKKITCEALIFSSDDYLSGISKESTVSLAYTPLINTWGGVRSIQLNLEDVKYLD